MACDSVPQVKNEGSDLNDEQLSLLRPASLMLLYFSQLNEVPFVPDLCAYKL